ncbi:hypothetical protein C2845_PM09G13910 [Panicum miliaceum]|uniref:Retrotransposon protein, putative, Ty3-gypsy subclass n=1 Tax=Panicum miliaceum TaxID=4540 RepID=A0A3L6S2R5_PANMI|nr:hypothetical protein C2845_PM09G13910 [Panicum miliaceum]
MVLDRFGKDQHELLVRQMISVRQTGSLSDYIDHFFELYDQLAAYQTAADPMYFTMQFIEGLRADIQAVVLLQRPRDLDTAIVLAQLQNEVVMTVSKMEVKKPRYSFMPKSSRSLPLPLPAPPGKEKLPVTSAESSRVKSPEEKWRSLRSLRRAQGLCQYCAEKWSCDHKCADRVQLHAVQELLEIFQLSDETELDNSSDTSVQNQLFLTLSSVAVSGTTAPKTICLQGMIQGNSMWILLDSGSSHTFISQELADKLQGVVFLSSPIRVQVANGMVLQCVAHVPQASWSVQSYSFVTDLKILHLSAYDMILGMDWLEFYSPMKVHWTQKWLAIPYENTTVVLYGQLPELPEATVMQVCAVQSVAAGPVDVHLLPEVQQLIEEFGELFQVSTELPPSRSCDHKIPLIAGAAPVSVRPYRYAPKLKDEIEAQVKEMLQNGLIQKSSSPFSSSVLLVKKKDGSWRFCVDYRHLNAITVKGKYPVPIIDEFLDELVHAPGLLVLICELDFTRLDYIQVRSIKQPSKPIVDIMNFESWHLTLLVLLDPFKML